MEAGSDALFRKIGLKCFPLRHANDIQVINGFCPGGFERKNDGFVAIQKFVIRGGMLAPLGIATSEVPELNPENSGLNRIEAAIIAFKVMVVFFRLAMVAQHSDFLGD